jgi:methionyl-tRNA synthetase
MIARYRGGTLAKTTTESPVDLDALREDLVARLDVFDITGALEAIWNVVRRLNQHVETTAPWQLAKDESRTAELDAVLYGLADGLTGLAIALAPYLPETAPQILTALGQPVGDLAWTRIAQGTAAPAAGIEPAAPLFPRVELATAAT